MRSALPDLICVDPEQVDEIWPHVEGMLKRATDHCGQWSIGPIRGEVFNGIQLLWITWDGLRIKAAATTRLQKENIGLICQAIACAGEDDDWPARFAQIENYARDEGCTAVRIQGRSGWARIFKDYKTEWVSLAKKLV